MRKVIGVSIIIVGLLIIFYPRLNEAYFAYQQKKLMEALVQSWEELDEYVAAGEDTTGDKMDEQLAQYVKEHMESILKIDKINLQMPVLKGATKGNLDITAASIDGTGKPGRELLCCRPQEPLLWPAI